MSQFRSDACLWFIVSLGWFKTGILSSQLIARMDKYEDFVAEIVERGPGHQNKHHLVPWGKGTPHFREVLPDSQMFTASPRLQLLFSKATWHIGEENNEGELTKVFATLDANRFPNKEDVWTNYDATQTTSFSCSLLTIDQYSTTVLLVNYNQGAASNQLAKFKEEYALAHAEAFNRIHTIEAQNAGIQATTAALKTAVGDLQQKQLDLLRDQGHVNNSIVERLEKLEEQAAGPPSKKPRVDKRCPNRHHERVQKHHWLNPGDMVLLLGNHHSLQKVVVESWAETHYIVCEKTTGKSIHATHRSMLWPCPKCLETDAAAA